MDTLDTLKKIKTFEIPSIEVVGDSANGVGYAVRATFPSRTGALEVGTFKYENATNIASMMRRVIEECTKGEHQ